LKRNCPIVAAFPFLGDGKTTNPKSIAQISTGVRESKFKAFSLILQFQKMPTIDKKKL
jgi:hypothetical protein